MDNKFRVGQMVDFVPSQAGIAPTAMAYKILRLLPNDGSGRRYQIKTIREAFERVAQECELVLRTGSVVAYANPSA
jgi:hypothetical protein